MATWPGSLKIEGSNVTLVEQYEPYLGDDTWKEINTYARELSLGCLSELFFAGDIIFNRWQSQDILMIEIPALRKKNLSVDAQKFLDGLEYAIKDMYAKDENIFLYFEGD